MHHNASMALVGETTTISALTLLFFSKWEFDDKQTVCPSLKVLSLHYTYLLDDNAGENMDFLTWFIALGDQLLYRQITTWGMTKEPKEQKLRITCIFFFFLLRSGLHLHSYSETEKAREDHTASFFFTWHTTVFVFPEQSCVLHGRW